MNPDSKQYDVRNDDLAQVASAVTQMAGHVRQIKILLIWYAVVTLAISLGMIILAFSGALGRVVTEQVRTPAKNPNEEMLDRDVSREADSTGEEGLASAGPGTGFGAGTGSGSTTGRDAASGVAHGSADGISEGVWRIGDGVSSPRLVHHVEPEYSLEARKAKREGTVKLAVEVWEDGKAHNIRIVESLGMGLDEKSVEAVKQWDFSPGN